MPTVVIASGPIFDGRAEKAANDACDEIEKSVATIGASMVRTNLNKVLRHQTPYYRLQVEAQNDPPGWKVTDQGVIYGPWLNGTGSRNRTTRFKGYNHWRKALQELTVRSKTIAEGVLRRYMGRMG